MSTITGVVQKIDTKFIQKLNKNMFDIIVNGKAYGIGMYAPRDVAEGDTVTFTATEEQWPKVERGTLRKASAAEASAAPAAPTKAYVANSFDDRQAVISKQAALNTAIAFVKMALDSGAINLGSSGPAKLGIIEAAMFEFAAKFHQFSTGETVEVPEVAGKVAKPKAAAKAAPAPAAPADDEWEDDLPEDL